MRLTPNQIEVLSVVADGNEDGSPTDLDEILERVSYKPTKQAIQFTIRSLVKYELIEKVGSENRRDRKRVLIGATALGLHFAFANKKSPSFVSSAIEDELFREIEGKLNDLG